MTLRSALRTRSRRPSSLNLPALGVTLAFSIAVVVAFAIDSGRCHELVVWSSQEKYATLDSIVAAYRPPAVDRRCVKVIVQKVASGDAEAALLNDERVDGRLPSVWWPAAWTWVYLLNQHRAELGKKEEIAPLGGQSLIKSPLVIAMPEKLADTLLSCKPDIGWRDILELAQDPRSCPRYTELWGRFRLAKTDPTVSTSGLHALIATYNAAVGKTGPLTSQEVRGADVRRFVQGVESSVVHYGESVSAFLESLFTEDDQRAALTYVSAIAVEEKQVFEYNRGNPSSLPCSPCPKPLPPVERLKAIYPKDGTLVADHPYIVLEAKWVSAAQKQAARDLAQYLEENKSVRDRFLSEGFRDVGMKADPEALTAPLFDPSGPRSTDILSDRSVLAEILSSWSSLRKRANILLLLDAGSSMASQVHGSSKLEIVKHAMTEALKKQLGPNDAIGLWTFTSRPGDQPTRTVVSISEFGDGAVIADSLAKIDAGTGERRLYAALDAAVQHVRTHFVSDRINAVVVLSDGDDDRSGSAEFTRVLDKLRDQPEDARVRVFTVAYDFGARGALMKIAQASKGRFYDATFPFEIRDVLRDVISNF